MANLQVNVRLTPELGAEVDGWAAELGVERGKLAKDILTEALAARREGRASFAQPATLSPGDLIATAARLERGVMEIDRISTVWAKHEAGMRKQERDDQLALTRTRNEFMAGLPERIVRSHNPIRLEMLAMAERIERQPRLDAIDGRQREHTEALKANTIAIERLEKQPRTHVSYTFWSGDWSGRVVGACMLAVGLVCIGSYLGLAMMLPTSWLAVRSANLALGGGDQAICALVNYRLSTNSCETVFDGKELKVRVKAKRGASAPTR